MARPKEFDSESVVLDAMNAFWQHGYNGTSVNDLLAETGLNRGSLYATFKDKRNLFLAALERYDREKWEALQQAFAQGGSPRTLLRQWMISAVNACNSDEGRRGCLMAKAAMELVADDAEVAALLRRLSVRNEKFVAEVVSRGQSAGEITQATDARVLARFLWNTLSGMRLMGMTSPTAREVREVVDVALKALD